MDKYKLEYAIKTAGYTIQEFCNKVGISRSAFYKKCNGLSEFTLSEIKSIVGALQLKTPDDIFFADEVS